MTREVRITVTSPEECTEEQFLEWIEFCTGYTGSISIENPLHEYDMNATNVDVD